MSQSRSSQTEERQARKPAPPWTRRELLAGGAGLAWLGVAATAGCTTTPTAEATSAGAGSGPHPAAAPPTLRDAFSDPVAAIDSGEAWVAFCEALKPLARHVTGPEAAEDPLARLASGLRGGRPNPPARRQKWFGEQVHRWRRSFAAVVAGVIVIGNISIPRAVLGGLVS